MNEAAIHAASEQAGQRSGAQLRLLGGFELRIDGGVEDLQPALRRLLALVALTPRGVERTFASFQLWPDNNEDRARANLRSALWRIRKLPIELITTTKTHLKLADAVWVDIRDGIGDVALAPQAGGAGPPLPFDALLSDLLPDWYDDWLVVERERLRQHTLRCIETRGRYALDVGDSPEAIQAGLAALSIDPLRDSAHRLVIEAHMNEGNEYEARRQMSRYRELLAFDPRVRPSAELEAMFEPQRAAS